MQTILFLKRLREYVTAKIKGAERSKGTFDSNWPLFKDVLMNDKVETESWGGKLVFVYFPSYSRYVTNDINHDEFLDKARMINSVEMLDLDIIDIHKNLFDKVDEPLIIFHFVLAGIIINWVIKVWLEFCLLSSNKTI